jgi:hypothetical protein
MVENMVELRKKKSGTLGFGSDENSSEKIALGGTRTPTLRHQGIFGNRDAQLVVMTKSLFEREVFFRNFFCSFFSHDCAPKRINFLEDCVQAHKVL